MSRSALGNARSSKCDEFYTLYKDVKFELDHYIDQFKDKIIYCPCDSEDSAFVKYFLDLESKHVIKELLYTSLKTGTDFLSDDAIDIYKHADIVVTNPPFSLFRQFISLLKSLDKRFIIWGNTNCFSYKVVSELIIHNKIRVGYIANKTCTFEVPIYYLSMANSKAFEKDDKYYIRVPSCSVFTNLDVYKQPIEITKKYILGEYEKYINYNALNVNKVKDIPIDYYDEIGVPITYLCNPDYDKFNILGIFNNFKEYDLAHGHIVGSNVILESPPYRTCGPCISNNKPVYARVIIKRK